MAPIVVMVFASINVSTDLFAHLWSTVLPEYIRNTLMVLGILVLRSLSLVLRRSCCGNYKSNQYRDGQTVKMVVNAAFSNACLFSCLFVYRFI